MVTVQALERYLFWGLALGGEAVRKPVHGSHASIFSPQQACQARYLQSHAEQIKKLQRNGSVEHEISVVWVPRRTLVSDKILEDEGVLGDVNVSELPLYFLPLEDDTFSLELDDAFNDLYLVGDMRRASLGRS